MPKIVFLVFDGMKMLDVTGPAEVFAEANLFGADYQVLTASPSGQAVRASSGATLSVDLAAQAIAAVDTLVVVGGDELPVRPISSTLLEATRLLAGRCERLVSICTGAFVLAAAGLARHRQVTTHWKHADLLARTYPDLHVQPDAIYVEDGNLFTSAGVSAGIDLALALVERDHGPAMAREVAKALVVFMQRPGGQSQFSAGMRLPVSRTPAIRAVVDHVLADPAGEHTIHTMARMAAVSPRHLARLFADELSVTPTRFLELCRLDAATAALERGYSVAAAARAAGFGTDERLRRSFKTHLGVTPAEYSRRFRSTLQPSS